MDVYIKDRKSNQIKDATEDQYFLNPEHWLKRIGHEITKEVCVCFDIVSTVNAALKN